MLEICLEKGKVAPREKFPWPGPLPLPQHPKALSWACLPTVNPFLCKEHSHVDGGLRPVHVPGGWPAAAEAHSGKRVSGHLSDSVSILPAAQGTVTNG